MSKIFIMRPLDTYLERRLAEEKLMQEKAEMDRRSLDATVSACRERLESIIRTGDGDPESKIRAKSFLGDAFLGLKKLELDLAGVGNEISDLLSKANHFGEKPEAASPKKTQIKLDLDRKFQALRAQKHEKLLQILNVAIYLLADNQEINLETRQIISKEFLLFNDRFTTLDLARVRQELDKKTWQFDVMSSARRAA